MVQAIAKKMLMIILLVGLLNPLLANNEISKVMVFGDSLSAAYGIDEQQGWVALLQQRLAQHKPDYRVVNASISGETTAGGAARINSAIGTFSPELIILELGANDGLRGFPPARADAPE